MKNLFGILLLVLDVNWRRNVHRYEHEQHRFGSAPAVADANAAAGADNIVFDATFNSPQTITLASTIAINGVNDTLTITGPGANPLTTTATCRRDILPPPDNINQRNESNRKPDQNSGTLSVIDMLFDANTNKAAVPSLIPSLFDGYKLHIFKQHKYRRLLTAQAARRFAVLLWQQSTTRPLRITRRSAAPKAVLFK